MRRTSIVVVDDSVTIRAMIENMLERDGRIEVSGIAANAEDGFDLVEMFEPDVVTVDINMPGTDGWMLLDRIVAQSHRPVVMLSTLIREGDPIVDEALARGAAACFNKSLIVRETPRFIDMLQALGAPQLIATLPEAFIAAQAQARATRLTH